MVSPPYKNADCSRSSTFLMFGNRLQDYLPYHFPRDYGEDYQPAAPRSSFLALLEKGVTFGLFQSSGTSPSSHELSKTVRTGRTMMPASFLSTCGCILSGHLDLCLSSVLKCSLVRYFSMRVSSLLQTFSLVSEISYS